MAIPLIRRLYERGFEREDIIQLFHFIDWVMALPEELEQEVWEEIQAYEREQRMPYISSVERIGLTKGLQQGLEQGRQQALRILLRLMEGRFGSIPSSLQAQLQALSVVQLEELVDTVLAADSLEQLAEYLAQKPSES